MQRNKFSRAEVLQLPTDFLASGLRRIGQVRTTTKLGRGSESARQSDMIQNHYHPSVSPHSRGLPVAQCHRRHGHVRPEDVVENQDHKLRVLKL